VKDLIAKGDKVIVRYIVRGVHTGDVEGFPATGNTFEASSIEIIRIEGEKIAESWEEYDDLGHYLQLGMELKPKEEK
jgi:predicted ester cyclase